MVIDTRSLFLDDIVLDDYKLPFGFAAKILESCKICFIRCEHRNEPSLLISGDLENSLHVNWNHNLTVRELDFYQDEIELPRDGAYCIAFLLLFRLISYDKVIQSPIITSDPKRSTGIDYWIGKQGEAPFQEKFRLEVSGILSPNERIGPRVSSKITQSTKSDHTQHPCYIVVVKFNDPEARVIRR